MMFSRKPVALAQRTESVGAAGSKENESTGELHFDGYCMQVEYSFNDMGFMIDETVVLDKLFPFCRYFSYRG